MKLLDRAFRPGWACAAFSRGGFTLVELLVITGVIGTLAGLLLPVLHHAGSISQGIKCLSNVRQLTVAWLLYADDQQGWLCPNGSGLGQGWVGGVLDFNGSTDNTNLLYLSDPQYAKLGEYGSSPALYRCPADKSMARFGQQNYPRVRSLAMNEAVGSSADGAMLSSSSGWQVYHKQNQITAPAPSKLWVLIEQHPDSIDDGGFAVDCQHRTTAAQWIDFPSNFHDRASNVSFADGHAETHSWKAAETMPPNRYCGCLAHYAARGFYTACPNSPDLAWLQERTSALKH